MAVQLYDQNLTKTRLSKAKVIHDHIPDSCGYQS
ncbi:hypothetical protein T11_7719, partial [Trichinella zimbabwensis]